MRRNTVPYGRFLQYSATQLRELEVGSESLYTTAADVTEASSLYTSRGQRRIHTTRSVAGVCCEAIDAGDDSVDGSVDDSIAMATSV